MLSNVGKLAGTSRAVIKDVASHAVASKKTPAEVQRVETEAAKLTAAANLEKFGFLQTKTESTVERQAQKSLLASVPTHWVSTPRLAMGPQGLNQAPGPSGDSSIAVCALVASAVVKVSVITRPTRSIFPESFSSSRKRVAQSILCLLDPKRSKAVQ